MATALPCLASAIGGNTDLLQDGRDGLLVPPDDPSAWSSALLRVLEDSPFARLLGDRKSTRLNSSHANISYAVFCLKKKNTNSKHIGPGPGVSVERAGVVVGLRDIGIEGDRLLHRTRHHTRRSNKENSTTSHL